MISLGNGQCLRPIAIQAETRSRTGVSRYAMCSVSYGNEICKNLEKKIKHDENDYTFVIPLKLMKDCLPDF